MAMSTPVSMPEAASRAPPGACSVAERLVFPTWSAVHRTSSESVR
jgi:hypothetical protein